MKSHKSPEFDIRSTDIVVGVDGSEPARSALRWAASYARLTGARVHAVTAWEYPPMYPWGPTVPHDDFAATAGKALTESVQDVLGSDADVAIEETVMPGHPAQVLIDASEHAALLVVGSRGHGGFSGALVGSVSQYCVQHSRCPVVVVRGRG
jgi:nucleotide-binding universal stress UspA family protein